MCTRLLLLFIINWHSSVPLVCSPLLRESKIAGCHIIILEVLYVEHQVRVQKREQRFMCAFRSATSLPASPGTRAALSVRCNSTNLTALRSMYSAQPRQHSAFRSFCTIIKEHLDKDHLYTGKPGSGGKHSDKTHSLEGRLKRRGW